MSKDKYVIKQIINRKPVPMPISELKEDSMFLGVHQNMISQIVEAKNNREFEFVCSQIQNFIEENNIGVCFAINKNELTDCLQEHQRLKLKIADLEAKLAESKNDYLLLEEQLENANEWSKDFQEENEQLNQQLAEKDEQLNSAQVGEEFALKCCDEANKLLALQVTGQHQDKISFAVEQLEKVKEKFISEVWDLYDTADLLEQVCELRNEQIKFIDNQIKQLKEGK